jgi:hypothetical protein
MNFELRIMNFSKKLINDLKKIKNLNSKIILTFLKNILLTNDD